MQVRLNDVLFPTMKARTEYVAAILDNTAAGERIADPVHERDIKALLASHPEAEDKIGAGVNLISAELHPGHRTKCFCALRSDGSKAYFSYHACLQGKSRTDSLRAKFNHAARQAVSREIRLAKYKLIERNGGLGVCEVTGKELPPDELSVDHKWPYGFAVIVDLFLKQTGLTLADALFKYNRVDQIELSDPALLEHFRKHHRTCSEGFLRLVAKIPNVTDAAQHRLVPAKAPLLLSSGE